MSPEDKKLFEEFQAYKAWKQSNETQSNEPRTERIVQAKPEYNFWKEIPTEWIPIIVVGGLAFFITTWPMLVLGAAIGAVITFYHLINKWRGKTNER